MEYQRQRACTATEIEHLVGHVIVPGAQLQDISRPEPVGHGTHELIVVSRDGCEGVVTVIYLHNYILPPASCGRMYLEDL